MFFVLLEVSIKSVVMLVKSIEFLVLGGNKFFILFLLNLYTLYVLSVMCNGFP